MVTNWLILDSGGDALLLLLCNCASPLTLAIAAAAWMKLLLLLLLLPKCADVVDVGPLPVIGCKEAAAAAAATATALIEVLVVLLLLQPLAPDGELDRVAVGEGAEFCC